MTRWRQKINGLLKNQGGFGLVESLVAMAIFGIGITGAIAALATGTFAVDSVNQQTDGHSLALSQLAYTKSYPYDATAPYSYPTVDILDATYNPHPITLPTGYSITVGVSLVSTDLQKITVTILKNGTNALAVDDFKTNR